MLDALVNHFPALLPAVTRVAGPCRYRAPGPACNE